MLLEDFNQNQTISSVEESQGNFDFVELVSFDDDPTEGIIVDDDGDDGTSVAATPAPASVNTVKKISLTPTVKKKPDTRGSVKSKTVRKRIGIIERRKGR